VRSFAQVEVQQPPALIALQVTTPFITLTTPGAQQDLLVSGLFSDRSSQNVARGFGLTYSSSAPEVVAVDANGMLTAVSDGTATVTIRHGTSTASVRVAVELRVAPHVTGIALAPFPAAVSADTGVVLAQATIRGTGTLAGLPVTFTLQGSPATFSAPTGYDGLALGRLTGLRTAGTFQITASIVHPSNGAIFADTTTLVVIPGSGDNEPNNDLVSAAPLGTSTTIHGTLGATADPRDTFRVETSTPGTLALTLDLPVGTTPGNVTVVLLAENGTELSRFTPTELTSLIPQDVAAGHAFVRLETTAGSLSYTLKSRFIQAPVTITSVNPASGGPGTLVTLMGTGFSRIPAENMVLFSTIAGKVMVSTATQLQVMVPANAVNGPIRLIVGSRQTTGPQFTTGNSNPPPPPSVAPINPAMIRLDPVSGAEVVVNRLIVRFDPTVPRSEIATLVTGLNGTLAGFLPTFNEYVLDFPTVQTIGTLQSLRQQLAADPRVTLSTTEILSALQGGSPIIDSRDRAGALSVRGWTNLSVPKGVAYDLIKLFDAYETIRQTPPYDDPAAFKEVTVAVIDSGFNPRRTSEFAFQGNAFIPLFESTCTGPAPLQDCTTALTLNLSDPHGHGTAITSIVAAVNDSNGSNGVLTGVFQPHESPNRFRIPVYANREAGTSNISRTNVAAALLDMLTRFPRVDVVNMSFGRLTMDPAEQIGCKLFYLQYLRLFPETLFTIAAGNEDADADFECPANLSNDIDNVMAIGAVAVANLDETGETADARAKFHYTPPERIRASNFGDGVTLAAPGEDIVVATRVCDPFANVGDPMRCDELNNRDSTSGYRHVVGTSAAAPIVAGVAGLLQAIRPNSHPAPFTPLELKQILVNTADDISATWEDPVRSPGNPMKRLNALSAVLAVLPPAQRQVIYVADQEVENSNSAPGRLLALDVDPLTGRVQTTANVIPLTVTQGNATLHGTKPTAILVSPAGDEAYAVVEDASGALGDGLLVINTYTLQVVNFLPLSGAPFTAPANPVLASVRASTNRTNMVFSHDGRLLYLGIGKRLLIINTVEKKVVQQWQDLPEPYRALAPSQTDLLSDRLARIAAALGGAGLGGVPIPVAPGISLELRSIVSLALAPDGKTLYAAIDSGQGGGRQPGVILPIHVDLYTDKEPGTPGLQSDLAQYLALGFPLQRFASMYDRLNDPLDLWAGDEPKAVTVSPDGKYVYLINGGVNYFQGLTPEPLDTGRYLNLFFAQAAGAASLGCRKF